jgi:hypothetical protein
VAVKRNRFIKLTGATKSVDRQLEAKARALAGLKGNVTNLPDVTAEFVIDAYTDCSRSRSRSGCPNTTYAAPSPASTAAPQVRTKLSQVGPSLTAVRMWRSG